MLDDCSRRRLVLSGCFMCVHGTLSNTTAPYSVTGRADDMFSVLNMTSASVRVTSERIQHSVIDRQEISELRDIRITY